MTHPTRVPFVRDTTYLDGKGPPPFAFFDEVQDYLVLLYQALLGSQWSQVREDFDAPSYPLVGKQQLGQFLADVNLNVTFSAILGPSTGDHGVWRMAPTNPAAVTRLVLLSGSGYSGGDFLLSAKVRILERSNLDVVGSSGFFAGMTNFAFVAGADDDHWQVRTPLASGAAPSLIDSGIPLLDLRWYTLQISRERGQLRFHINGQAVRIAGNDGVYYPDSFSDASRKLALNQPTGAGGFDIDFFHALFQRVIP